MIPDDDVPRRHPRTIGGAVYLLVVATAAIGLLAAVCGPWRTGVAWLGVAVVICLAARLVIPERQAGMLRVRRKLPDVVLMLLAGVALIVLSIVVPDQRG